MSDWREGQAAEERPSSYRVTDIKVADDGLSLIGHRYQGYVAEVTRRQAGGEAQDSVTVWYRPGPWVHIHVTGIPHVNAADGLEILNDGKVLGTIRLMGRVPHFFPES